MIDIFLYGKKIPLYNSITKREGWIRKKNNKPPYIRVVVVYLCILICIEGNTETASYLSTKWYYKNVPVIRHSSEIVRYIDFEIMYTCSV